MFSKVKHWLKTSNRQSLLGLAVALVLAIGGVASISVAVAAQQSPPKAHSSGQLNTPKNPKVTSPSQPVLGYSRPVAISIPSIKVHSRLTSLGKNADGSVQVPTKPQLNDAGWYKYSPAPGQYGASVILGHIDTYNHGPSVFYNLGKLAPSNRIKIARQDGTVAIFKVQAVRQYAKTKFPSSAVYSAHGGASELRLITCGGSFSQTTGHYDKNTVVFAKLVKSGSAVLKSA